MYKILGTPTCSFCGSAKELLDTKGIQYEYTDITKDNEALSLFREKGFRTVPQIFKGDVHIGGFQDLQKHLES